MFGDLISSVKVFDGEILRNIKGIRESQDLYDDLGDSGGDYLFAQAAADIGVPETQEALLTRPFDYGVAITYPFINENWQYTRFSDGAQYGVWYGSLEIDTTIHESVYHWRQFVSNAFPMRDKVTSDRRVFTALCRGILIDLVDKETAFPALVHPSDYSFTNMLGKYVREQNQNGLLAKSARCNGTNAAIFTPKILSNIRDYCFLTYIFSPAKGGPVRIERTRGKQMMLIEVM